MLIYTPPGPPAIDFDFDEGIYPSRIRLLETRFKVVLRKIELYTVSYFLMDGTQLWQGMCTRYGHKHSVPPISFIRVEKSR